MNFVRFVLLGLVASGGMILSGVVAPADAQQATVGVPQPILRDGFYESFGLNWGFSRRYPGGGGFFFNNGGFGGALPAFGGFDPNAGANFGFGAVGPNGAFHLNFAAGQGSDRSFTSTTPILTLPQGGMGSIQSGEIRPFVTGIVPVVGGGGPVVRTDPLSERLRRLQEGETPGVRMPGNHGTSTLPPAAANTPSAPVSSPDATGSSSAPGGASTAVRGDLSVREIRQRRIARDEAAATELAELIERGAAAEEQGQRSVARVYYSQALRRASGEQAEELRARLARLK